MDNDNNYDVIICGTGIIQGILSALMAIEGKKVLQIDRNAYYGGEGQQVNLSDLWKIFRPDQKPPDDYGKNRDWNVDLIPKLLPFDGKLIKILSKTKVLKYLDLKYIDENLICLNKNNQLKLFRIPINENQNQNQNELISEEQKIKYFQFLDYVRNHENQQQQFNLNELSFNDLANQLNLDQQSVELLGNVLGQQLNDDFLTQPAIQTVQRIKSYLQSQNNQNSPFTYPIYGLSSIPEGFSRIVAVYGGTVMLASDVDEIIYDKGKVAGIKSPSFEKQVNSPIIIADPSYVNNRSYVKNIWKIIRCVCILNHSIPGYDDKSLSITIPKSQTGRKNDIYITVLDNQHCITVQGYRVCVISTNIETNDPEKELEVAFKLVDPILEKFTTVSDYRASNQQNKNLYIINSYNASNNLETEIDQVLEIYQQITGKNLDLANLEDDQLL